MILKRQNMSEHNWNHFKIVLLLTQSLSTVNCQFGEAAKFQFHDQLIKTDNHNSNLSSQSRSAYKNGPGWEENRKNAEILLDILLLFL